jgi:hypothetical protein
VYDLLRLMNCATVGYSSQYGLDGAVHVKHSRTKLRWSTVHKHDFMLVRHLQYCYLMREFDSSSKAAPSVIEGSHRYSLNRCV